MNESNGAPAGLPESPRWPPILYGAFAAFVLASAQVVLLGICFAMALSMHGEPTRAWDALLIGIEVGLGVFAVATLTVGFLPRSSRFVRLFARTAGIASVAVVLPIGAISMAFVRADLGSTINTATPVRTFALPR